MPNPPWNHNTLFQLTLLGTALGQQIVNVFNFEASGVQELSFGDDAARITASGDLADKWITGNKLAFVNASCTDYVLQNVKCQVMEVRGSFRHKLSPIERAQTTSNAGPGGYPAEHPGASVVVRWRTNLAGKRFRARSYLGPVPATAQVDGRVSGPYLTAMSTFVTGMTTRWAAGHAAPLDYYLTVYSRPYNEGEYQYTSRKTGTLQVVTPVEYEGNSTNVTTAQIDTILRSQRRRNIGVGN